MTALRYGLLSLILSPLLSSAQDWNWATPFFGTGAPHVEAVAALNDGGALVCGEFNDTLRTASDTIITHGDQDGFLARLDNTGAVLWLMAIGGDQYDELNDVVVDGEGNAFAAATFADTANWSGTDIVGGAGREAVLVKFDLDGSVLWYRRAEGYTYGYTVSVGGNGIAHLGGVINENATFSGIDLESTAGIFNAFIVRYTAEDGTIIDADVVSSSTGDFGAYGMDVDAAGNIYLTGYSRPQQNPYVGTFMAKLAYGGGTGWIQTVTSAFGDLYGYDVSVTNEGHVYFTGNIYNNVTWMGDPFGQYGHYDDAYLARFATDGTLDWVQRAGWNAEDLGLGVAADGLGNAYWTGCFYRQADFDTIHVDSYNNGNWQDVFVARAEPTGGAAFVSTGGGGSDDRATAIDKRTDGPVIIGGQYFSYNAAFGDHLLPMGGRCFVASMAAPDDDLSTGVVEASETFPLQLVPVPAQHTLFLAMPGARGAVDYVLTDASGRTAMRGRLGAPFGPIDISGLRAGLYVVRCSDAEGHIRTARAVVER